MNHLQKYAGRHREAVQRATDREDADESRDGDVPGRGLRVTGTVWVVVAHGGLAEGLLRRLSGVAGEQNNLWPLSNRGLGTRSWRQDPRHPRRTRGRP